MRQRIITGIIFTLAVLLFVIPSFWLPSLMMIFSIIVGAVSMYELLNAFKKGGFVPNGYLVIIGGIIAALTLFVCYLMQVSLIVALALYLLTMIPYCLACLILPSVIDMENHLSYGAVTGFTVLYVTFPMFCLTALTMLAPGGWFFMVPALFAAWVSDVCAYFVGVTLGKHKIVPHLSPKKTWEGCIGGAVGCAIVVMAYFDILHLTGVISNSVSIVYISALAFFLGFIMSVMSQLGDWLASLIKRMTGIKDYGNIFPGHGGMLDRFDSAFFTIPMGVLLAFFAVLMS
ncbi:MAG: phosphatidate cytidylyltransferase [Clostridiales bacterium]|nr:phosphatidate cytidylyltransferase [Clostridiales bacterium]